MNKTFFCMALSALCIGTAWAQHTVEITGKVQITEDNMKIIALQRDGTSKKTLAETTVNPTDKTYKLTVTVDKPGCVSVVCGCWQDVLAWVEDENLEIDFRGKDTAQIIVKSPPYVYIKGGKKNEVMNLINHELYRNYQNMITLSEAVYSVQVKDEKAQETLTAKLFSVSTDDFMAHIQYIATHYADRTSVLTALSYLNPEKYAALIETTLRTLEQNNPGTTLAEDFRAKAKAEQEKREQMKEGHLAPALSLPDANGKMHSLEEFKGKVLVMDFWASWCGPCRAEIPHLKKFYEEFKDSKKVAFLSIAIDDKREDWEKAVKEENMPWLQLLAGDASERLMDTYQFGGIPFILVLDQEGRIYKKQLRGEHVKEAIEEVLAK